MKRSLSVMNVTTETKAACLAIVSVFETSRPQGDFAAYAVLDDGAGVSYGISQFTHRSGSLAKVVETYIARGGVVGRKVFEDVLPLLSQNDGAAIGALAADRRFAKALKAAALTREMRAAQASVGEQLYFRPAIAACDGLGLGLPLSLAVVYDSVVHGSWAKLRGMIDVASPLEGGDEKAWVTSYVRKRHAWLTASPRLSATSYRTRFFLDQIARGRWELELPLRVHGVLLTRSLLASAIAENDSAAEPAIHPSETHPDKSPGVIEIQSEATSRHLPGNAASPNTQPPNYRPDNSGVLDAVERSVNGAARQYDRVEAVVKTVITRKDAAKSLWTTVIGSLWQFVWAVIGFALGIPRQIWLAAAVIMGVLAVFYLYRQITLAKIRERTNSN